MLHQEDLIVLTPCSRLQHVLGHLCCLSVGPVLSCVGFFLAYNTTTWALPIHGRLCSTSWSLKDAPFIPTSSTVSGPRARYIQLPEIAPFYTTRLDAPQMPTLNTNIEGWLREAGHPDDGYVLVQVENVPEQPHAGPPPYHDYVHKDGRAILCMYNFAANDWVDIQAGEDDFFALLATDNGKGQREC